MEHTLFLIGIALLIVFVYIGFGIIIGMIFLSGEDDDDFKKYLPKFMVFWPFILVYYAIKSLFDK